MFIALYQMPSYRCVPTHLQELCRGRVSRMNDTHSNCLASNYRITAKLRLFVLHSTHFLYKFARWSKLVFFVQNKFSFIWVWTWITGSTGWCATNWAMLDSFSNLVEIFFMNRFNWRKCKLTKNIKIWKVFSFSNSKVQIFLSNHCWLL